MKKILIIDGNADDESKVKELLGEDYDVSAASYMSVNNMALSTVITIANTLDACDEYSSGRSLRVAVCARDIAKNLGWDEHACQNIYFVALLHDMGMITVPDSIVNKPERLEDSEFEAVKRHAGKGAEMLRDIDVLENLSDGILYHHERWDGRGDPKGLKEDEIPAVARVIAIAEAYDAMNSDRVYRPRMSTDKIISEFIRCKGTQFDPDIADVFVFMLKDGYSIDPDIEQTKEASDRASRDGGLRKMFTQGDDAGQGNEMDELTGLFTRSYLNTSVGNRIAKERSGALMMMDITGYDDIRSRYGDVECDRMIRNFSQRLRSLFREEDVVCRMSKDRFAVFVSGESGKSVIEKKAGMITGIMDKYDEFIKYREMAGVAIGISVCQEDGITFEELYGVALSALEEAKQSGQSTYRFRDVK